MCLDIVWTGDFMADMKWTIDQAARALGVSEKTIYRRIKSGQLHAALQGTPPTQHWMIEPVTDIRQDIAAEVTPDKDENKVEHPETLIRILEEQLREKDRQISELHVLLRESQGQMVKLLPASTQESPKPARKRRWWIF